MENSKAFMAFASGEESKEGGSFKNYIGLGVVKVLAVNPNKAELEKIYGRDLDKAPEYMNTVEIGPEGSKKSVPQTRIDFIVATDPELNNGIEWITKVSFFVAKAFQTNNDGTKIKVINTYGETTWLTIEDAKNKIVPENLSWFENSDIRPCYRGEEELTAFIKAYLNIPNKSYRKADGTIVTIPDKKEAEARLDKIADYFTGNFSELSNVIKLRPTNVVKCAFGVKTTSDNRMFADVFKQMFMKRKVTDTSRLEKAIAERQAAGAYASTQFELAPLREYSVAPTNFSESESKGSESDPWGDTPMDAGNPWG